MLTEYIDEALRRARYELIEDEETPCYGEVPELPGVWASGRTLEGCRRELKEVVEGWILVSVRRTPDARSAFQERSRGLSRTHQGEQMRLTPRGTRTSELRRIRSLADRIF